MSHDVFISHSSMDKPTADAICAALESSKISCWIAPRDIVPGSNWGEAIIDAINGSRLMVFVFSSHSNHSSQVMREIERAVHHGLPIIPIRIEDVRPSKALEYFLSVPHWLDALTPPLQAHLSKLKPTVQSLLASPDSRGDADGRDVRPIFAGGNPSKPTHTRSSPFQEAPPDEWFYSNADGIWRRLWKFLTRE